MGCKSDACGTQMFRFTLASRSRASDGHRIVSAEIDQQRACLVVRNQIVSCIIRIGCLERMLIHLWSVPQYPFNGQGAKPHKWFVLSDAGVGLHPYVSRCPFVHLWQIAFAQLTQRAVLLLTLRP
jgi:hypothetical protein